MVPEIINIDLEKFSNRLFTKSNRRRGREPIMGIKRVGERTDVLEENSEFSIDRRLKEPGLLYIFNATWKNSEMWKEMGVRGVEHFGVGYYPYTGSWYAYNLDTGAQIAEFNTFFFNAVLREHYTPFSHWEKHYISEV